MYICPCDFRRLISTSSLPFPRCSFPVCVLLYNRPFKFSSPLRVLHLPPYTSSTLSIAVVVHSCRYHSVYIVSLRPSCVFVSTLYCLLSVCLLPCLVLSTSTSHLNLPSIFFYTTSYKAFGLNPLRLPACLLYTPTGVPLPRNAGWKASPLQWVDGPYTLILHIRSESSSVSYSLCVILHYVFKLPPVPVA